jgi:hypothetical protein
VAQFIGYARDVGVHEDVVFETNDLVDGKNHKRVLYWQVLPARARGDCPPVTLASPPPPPARSVFGFVCP